MDYLQQGRGIRGAARGRAVALAQQQSRGEGRGFNFPPQDQQSVGSPLMPPTSSKQPAGGGGTYSYPSVGQGDFIKQLQLKIGNLEHQLMCSHVEQEKLHLELSNRSKLLETVNEKYAKLEEEFESVASYAAKAFGGVQGGADQDQNFAQKCVKLEAKIAKNKALSAEKERIKTLEEKVKKLEEEKKSLEESLLKQETDLEIQRSLNTRFHGMFRMFAEAATENCKEIDSFVAGLSEEGIITLEDDSPTQTPVEEVGGNRVDKTLLPFIVDSPSPATSFKGCLLDDYGRSSGGSSAFGGDGDVRVFNDLNTEEEDIPPPAAFLDAIKNLTQEELDELERL